MEKTEHGNVMISPYAIAETLRKKKKKRVKRSSKNLQSHGNVWRSDFNYCVL